MTINTKYLIIGAGISGLTAATYLKKDYIVIEKENEVGGYCRTIRKKDFIWDYAGHFFHFNTDEFKKKFIEEIDKDDILTKEKCTKIFYNQDLVDYPFQTNIHQLNKAEFIDCLYDLFNKVEKEEYDNFLDMLYGKFGISIVEKFLKPYNEKLYATDLKKLDKDAMGRFFPYADKEAIIKNMKRNKDIISYNTNFLYPKNGAGSFIDILYHNIDTSKVQLETEIISIDTTNKVAVTNHGDEIHYEYLINTMPLNTLLEIIDNNQYKKLQDSLSYNKVLVFNLGFNKKSTFNKEHWVYFPEQKYNFYRVGFYDNILDSNKLSMYIEIGYPKDGEIDVKKQLELTLDSLEKSGIIDKDTKLEEYVSIIMDPAYVHISTETNDKVKDFKDEMKDKNVFTIGRYGGWTYCSMEDCMLEAKQLAEDIM